MAAAKDDPPPQDRPDGKKGLVDRLKDLIEGFIDELKALLGPAPRPVPVPVPAGGRR